MLSRSQLVKALREAGNVARCHTVPHHGEYSVGLHSYGVVNIILCLKTDPSIALIKAALWHDAQERWLGDLPAPAKWFNKALNDEYVVAETRVGHCLGISKVFSLLNKDEQEWLRAADRLELLLWCDEQIAMGNRHVENMSRNVVIWFNENKDSIPYTIKNYMKTRPKWERMEEDIR
jgi:5'-deoxynucleotidase YfbR-like HD superfamily hydrolase